jgi:hypothetical protein
MMFGICGRAKLRGLWWHVDFFGEHGCSCARWSTDAWSLGHTLGEYYNRFGACSILSLFSLHLYCFKSCTVFQNRAPSIPCNFYWKSWILGSSLICFCIILFIGSCWAVRLGGPLRRQGGSPEIPHTQPPG